MPARKSQPCLNNGEKKHVMFKKEVSEDIRDNLEYVTGKPDAGNRFKAWSPQEGHLPLDIRVPHTTRKDKE